MYKLLILFLFLLSVSCEKEDHQFGYPLGVRVSDMETENDCSLDECSEKRVRRLVADRVEGKIKKEMNMNGEYYIIRYSLNSGSYMIFYICDLPSEYQQDNLDIRFSGDLFDACGIRENIHPFNENYLLTIHKIKKR